MNVFVQSTSLQDEFGSVGNSVLARVEHLLREAGLSNKIVQHARNLGGYHRVPHCCAAWVEDPKLRFDLGTSFCIHTIGLKFLDDIIDGDTDVDPRELAFGAAICDYAVQALLEIDPKASPIKNFEAQWLPIWRTVLAEPTNEISTIAAWEKLALAKAGNWLSQYSDVAARVTNRPHLAPVMREVLGAFGLVYQVSDDLRDHAANAHDPSSLVRIAINSHDVAVEAEEMFARTVETLRTNLDRFPPALNFRPKLNVVTDKCAKGLADIVNASKK